MRKDILILVILTIIIIILIGVLIFIPVKKNPQKNPQTNISGIEIISPKANENIYSPIKITGVVNGNGWVGFEGQVGTVKVLDLKGNVIGQGILTATTEWTKLPTNFETVLYLQLDKPQFATLLFHNENPSGDPTKDKTFTMPVSIGVIAGT